MITAAAAAAASHTCRSACGMLLSVAAWALKVGILFLKTSIQLSNETGLDGSLQIPRQGISSWSCAYVLQAAMLVRTS